jgi:flagellar assembly factor FliW
VALAIESTRFGNVEIDPETVIEFPDGLIGLGGTRFALLTSDPDSPFLWLHCIDDPSLSLPVTDPHRFFSNYEVELTDEDAERLGLDDWNGQGHQIINQAPGTDLRAPLFAEVMGSAGDAS